MRRVCAIMVALTVILAALAPSVAAAKTYTVDGVIRYSPSMTGNVTYNMTDQANWSLTSYNATVVPFMNESGINGTFTGPFMPPMLYQLSEDDKLVESHLMSVVKFQSRWVMSGSSVSWWRVPMFNITDWDYFYLNIWHLDRPEFLEGLDEFDPPIPTAHTLPTLTYSDFYRAEEFNITWRRQNITAWDYDWSFVWARVDAPIHADETYLVDFEINTTGGHDTGILASFAQTDVGDDEIYQTIWYQNGTKRTVEADLDISVIHEYGMGYSVSGFEVIHNASHFMPADDITEAVSPSGTDYGRGTWDGDWATQGVSVVVDNTDVVIGTNSIKGNDLDYGHRLRYTFDDAQDLSSHTSLRFYVKPENTMDTLRLRMYTDSLNYAQQKQTVTVDKWNYVTVDIDPTWSGWSQVSSPNLSSIAYIDILNMKSGTTNLDLWIDGLHFYGNNSIQSVLFHTRTDEAVTQNENITFLMPFMKDISNTSNALVKLQNVNGTWQHQWWVAENGTTDFTIKSLQWDKAYTAQVFYVNVTFYNSTNAIFIHDHNTELDSDFDERTYNTNLFYVQYVPNINDTGNLRRYFFRPFHSIQVSNGTWENSILDPQYMLDGRLYDMDELRLIPKEHSDPMKGYIETLIFATSFMVFGVWGTFTNIVLFPDAYDPETYMDLAYSLYAKLASWLKPVWVALGDFYEFLERLVEFAPYLFGAIIKGIELFIFVPFFFVALLVVNGLKRFFIILSRDGFEASIEYAQEFWKNSFSLVYKTPVAKLATRGVARYRRSRA